MKRRFEVVLVAKLPNGKIQVDLEPEGARANPRPVPQTDEEKVMDTTVQTMERMNPGITAAGRGAPKTILILTEIEYTELGYPGPSHILELTVEKV